MDVIKLDLGLEDTHVVVTGGGGMIGSAVVSAFLSAGAKVSCFDISDNALTNIEDRLKEDSHLYPQSSQFSAFKVDISKEEDVAQGFALAKQKFGPIQCCVALASLDLSVLSHHSSLADMPFDQWKRTFDVNVHGTFLTARAWLQQLRDIHPNLKNVSLIIVGSESGLFGEKSNADYASGKSAVQGGLLSSLKADVPRVYPGARANAIAPGPVDTPKFRQECSDDPKQYYADTEATTALGTPVPVATVARSIVYLASEAWSGHVHGQILSVDGGKQGKLMWTEEEGRRLKRS